MMFLNMLLNRKDAGYIITNSILFIASRSQILYAYPNYELVNFNVGVLPTTGAGGARCAGSIR
ncbi:unnamed protein product [Amoebophrya sp. A25]|nr:unnamed protein product [Amoebophrya sp. A25]|eukprot:GSA25T00006884001.1